MINDVIAIENQAILEALQTRKRPTGTRRKNYSRADGSTSLTGLIRRRRVMTNFRAWSLEDMEGAYYDVTENGINISVAAKKWGVPRTTLLDRVRKVVPLDCRMGCPTKMSAADESALVAYCEHMSRQGIFISSEMFLKYAGAIMRHRGVAVNREPSQNWFKAFRKRHPDLLLVRASLLRVMSGPRDLEMTSDEQAHRMAELLKESAKNRAIAANAVVHPLVANGMIPPDLLDVFSPIDDEVRRSQCSLAPDPKGFVLTVDKSDHMGGTSGKAHRPIPFYSDPSGEVKQEMFDEFDDYLMPTDSHLDSSMCAGEIDFGSSLGAMASSGAVKMEPPDDFDFTVGTSSAVDQTDDKDEVDTSIRVTRICPFCEFCVNSTETVMQRHIRRKHGSNCGYADTINTA